MNRKQTKVEGRWIMVPGRAELVFEPVSSVGRPGSERLPWATDATVKVDAEPIADDLVQYTVKL